MNNLYVTFAVYDCPHYKRKIAVECKDIEKAKEVACDAYSVEGVVNVRLRRCGKPTKDRRVISYGQYWNFKTWYFSHDCVSAI